MQQMLQEQETRLKEVFTTQISALAASINTLMQVSNRLLTFTVSTGHAGKLRNGLCNSIPEKIC